MAQACSIETLDRSGRWYFTPGAKSIYDLRVRNDSNNSLDCSLVLEDPSSGVSVEPQSLTLRGHEVRTVTVVLAADAPVPRSQRVLLTLRNNDGTVLATFEHPLIITGGTDCSVSLAWKDAVVEAGEVRGFELTCSVRSQSDGPSSFALAFTPHPALTFPPLDPLSLGPGESAELTVPVKWDSSIKDDSGINHPGLLEVGVPVSNGRRTSRIRWDAIAAQLKPFAWNSLLATVQGSPAVRKANANGNGSSHANTDLSGTGGDSSGNGNGGNGNGDRHGTGKRLGDRNPARATEYYGQTADTAAAHEVRDRAEPPTFQEPARKADAPATEHSAPPLDSQQTTQQALAQISTNPVAPAEVERKVSSPEEDAAASGFSIPENDVSELVAAATKYNVPLGVPEAMPPASPRRDKQLASYDTAAVHRSQRFISRPKRKSAAGWIIGALAVTAVVIGAVLFRPSNLQPAPSVGPVVVRSAVVAPNGLQPSTVPAGAPSGHDFAPHKNSAAKIKTRSGAAPIATQLAPTPLQPAASAIRPTTTRRAATSSAHHLAHALRKPVALPTLAAAEPAARFRRSLRRPRLAAPPPGPVVALGGVEAHYGARGRAVRVNWAAAEQTAANVQLIDNRGTTVNSITVRGARQSVLLYLPPGYHGAVTVQLTSIGRLGERVAQTASLRPFGY